MFKKKIWCNCFVDERIIICNHTMYESDHYYSYVRLLYLERKLNENQLNGVYNLNYFFGTQAYTISANCSNCYDIYYLSNNILFTSIMLNPKIIKKLHY